MNDILQKKDQQFVWHPYTQSQTAPAPIVIKRALGAYLYTSEDHRLFDGISSWWLNSHGHCHKYINDAIYKQSSQLEHVIFAGFTHEPAVSLAEKIIAHMPPGLSRVFYSDNGSTAVEVAIKMAWQYWYNRGEHRPHFIALEHSYHGDTFGAMAASDRSVFTKPFWPLLFNVLKTKSPCSSEAIGGLGEADITNNALKALARLFEQHQDRIAGVIIEPMLQGAGGMRMFTPGFLSGVKDLCKKNNTLLIADEVATGFYRTGLMFACEHENVVPDIICLAKGLSGGYLPLAATVATEEIYRAFLSKDKSQALLHGHSFTANPLGCAAALASLELFASKQTQENIKNITRATKKNIDTFLLPQIKHARSIGTIGAIELKSKESGYLSSVASAVYEYCFSRGLYIRPLGNVVYLMPPLCASVEEINWAYSLIYEALMHRTAD